MKHTAHTLVLGSLAALFSLSALADHNSVHGAGWANMPDDIHNTRIEDDLSTTEFRDFVAGGAAPPRSTATWTAPPCCRAWTPAERVAAAPADPPRGAAPPESSMPGPVRPGFFVRMRGARHGNRSLNPWVA